MAQHNKSQDSEKKLVIPVIKSKYKKKNLSLVLNDIVCFILIKIVSANCLVSKYASTFISPQSFLYSTFTYSYRDTGFFTEEFSVKVFT